MLTNPPTLVGAFSVIVKLQTSRRFVSSSTGDVEAVCRGQHLAGGEDGAAAAVQGEAEVSEVHQQHHLPTTGRGYSHRFP